MPTIARRPARLLQCGLVAALSLSGVVSAASAVEPVYPVRPVRFIVPFAPGGSTDTLARTLAQRLSDALGQQVVVDNRAGGNGNIGTELVARAAPDGHSIVLGYIANLGIGPSLYAKLPFDPVRDFAPITLLAVAPNILVAHPSVPVKSVRELVAYAKANTQKVNYASAAVASLGHLAGELLNSSAGIQMQHVPYKGSGQAVIDLLAGQVQIMFSGMSSVMPHIKGAKLRPLAVTGARCSAAAPEVPTIAESGYPGFEASAWYSVMAPAGTPRSVVMRLNSEILRALKVPEVKERLENVGFEIVGSSPDECATYIRSEIVKWAKVVKASGIKAE